MKSFRSAAALILAGAMLLPVQARSQTQAEVLTNESVVQMVTGKVPKALILTKIQSTSTAFDITPKGLVALHVSKVSDDVIKQMMKATTTTNSKEVLTNADVVAMVTGGLAKDLILLKIETTKGQYDMTTSGLVSLNQSKVPQDIMKVMMTPRPEPSSTPPASQPALPTSPPVGAPAPNAKAAATAAAPVAAKARTVSDGASASINTTLTVAAATAKVRSYLSSKHIASTVDKTTGAIVSDWYSDRACDPAPNHCMNRSNTKVVSEGGKVVIRVQVFERRRESGGLSKPWTDTPTSRGKETAELADALEAYLAK